MYQVLLGKDNIGIYDYIPMYIFLKETFTEIEFSSKLEVKYISFALWSFSLALQIMTLNLSF